jgi:hypothetical protein
MASPIGLITGFPYEEDLQYSIEKSPKRKDVRGRGCRGSGRGTAGVRPQCECR